MVINAGWRVPPLLTSLIAVVGAVSWSLGLARVGSQIWPVSGMSAGDRIAPLPSLARRAPVLSEPEPVPQPVIVAPPATSDPAAGQAVPAHDIRAVSLPAPDPLAQVPLERAVTAGPTRVPYHAYLDPTAKPPTGLPLVGPFVKWGQVSTQLDMFCGFQDLNYPGHTGVDLLVDPGAEVQATLSGLVVWAAENGPYGNLVVIENGGWQIWLAHLSTISVAPGDLVVHGQQIGASGGQPGAPGAGSSGGPHLHYAIRVYSDPTNPRGVWIDPTALMPMDQVRYTGCKAGGT